ncbi:kinase-like domain-containing protein [Aspergillus tetrazonus]
MYSNVLTDTETDPSEIGSEAESGIVSATDVEVSSDTSSESMHSDMDTETNDEAEFESVSVVGREIVSITSSVRNEEDIELGLVKERGMTSLSDDERESVMALIDAAMIEMGVNIGSGIGLGIGNEDTLGIGSVGSVSFGFEGGSAASVYNAKSASEVGSGVGSEAEFETGVIDSGFYSEIDIERDDNTDAGASCETSCETGVLDSGFESERDIRGNDDIGAEMDLEYNADAEMIVIKSDTGGSTHSGSDIEWDSEIELELETDLDREIREKVTMKLSRTKPLDGKVKTVVIKHAEPFLAVNRAWDLRTDRCTGEGTVIRALNEMFDVRVTNITRFKGTFRTIVRAPELYHINYAAHILIMEHLPDAINLHNFLTNMLCLSDERLHPWCFFIGSNLGHWLHAFHEWIANDQQKQLAKDFDNSLNKAMADLKFHINYEKLLDAVEKYPKILNKKKTRRIFRKVVEMARAEVREGSKNGRTGPIHGDFWAGNIILPITALQDLEKDPKPDPDAEDDPRHIPCPQTTLLITDWEFAQYGPHALDIGRMVAELYMLHHFQGIEAASSMLEGFLDGYEHITMETSYRMLIHIGVHFIVWGSRRANGVGTEKQVRKLIKLGRKFIVKGWKRDRYAFLGDFWNCLFKGYSD